MAKFDACRLNETVFSQEESCRVSKQQLNSTDPVVPPLQGFEGKPELLEHSVSEHNQKGLGLLLQATPFHIGMALQFPDARVSHLPYLVRQRDKTASCGVTKKYKLNIQYQSSISLEIKREKLNAFLSNKQLLYLFNLYSFNFISTMPFSKCRNPRQLTKA